MPGHGSQQRWVIVSNPLVRVGPAGSRFCERSANIERSGLSRFHMSDKTSYTPPKIWEWDKESGGRFASMNRPTAGATHDQELPEGKHDLQLYSLGTPNGAKVTILLEELVELGISEAEYDAWPINIGENQQFGSGFVSINPNSKIPALLDKSSNPAIRVFESGAILVHLAEKFQKFLPTDPSDRAECMSWLFWQMGSAPYLGGGFGHFYAYAPEKIEYAINRFTLEIKRQLDVLDQCLGERQFLCGNDYTIADMAVFPWYGALATENMYGGGEFIQAETYLNVIRWANEINARPPVERGRRVNRPWGPKETRVTERHSPADFEIKPSED